MTNEPKMPRNGALPAPDVEPKGKARGTLERLEQLSAAEASDRLARLSPEEAAKAIATLAPQTAAAILAYLEAPLAAEILTEMKPGAASALLGVLPPDDRVDVLGFVPAGVRESLIRALNAEDAAEVRKLEGYPADTAGGIMTTEVAAVSDGLTVEQAVAEVRRLNKELEHLYYVYVTDPLGLLVGVLSMRDMLLADPQCAVTQIMHPRVISVSEAADQEHVARLMQKHDYVALPVVDAHGKLVGVVTIDDVVDVLDEEATEDIQKIGGTLALEAPYLSVGFLDMLKKRGGWLSVLFLGEMLTATAMGFFQHQIARAVVLALFVPLIISSGGNAGSQAATLVIRSLALGELRLTDWLRVLGRELQSGLALGLWLGGIGFLRIILWQRSGWMDYGQHYLRLGATVWLSLVGVVLFGTLAGAMLPLLIRRLGSDPAASSTPFVATLVDVTGLVIYFMIAGAVLRGTLL